MAKQHYGINDGYHGAVGTVIGYQWRGRWCLRARPRQVRNPRTVAQQHNRHRFAQATCLASSMGEALRIGFHQVALEEHRTVYNHFLSVNNGCFATAAEQPQTLAVDYEHLVISEGPVALVGFLPPTLQSGVEGTTVTVPFEKNPLHLRADSDDKVYLYAWCPALQQGVLSLPAYRRCRQANVTLPDCWQGCEVHLYGFVQDYASRASDNIYLGCGVFGACDATDVAVVSETMDHVIRSLSQGRSEGEETGVGGEGKIVKNLFKTPRFDPGILLKT